MARTAKSPKGKTTASTKKVSSNPTRGAKQAKSAAAAKAPKLSVAELRAKLEKLERANATLRTKSREAGRTAKTATARIVELEAQVTGLEKKLAKTALPAKSKPAPSGRAKRKSVEVDQGDAVPPSVADSEPAPLEDEAATAHEI